MTGEKPAEQEAAAEDPDAGRRETEQDRARDELVRPSRPQGRATCRQVGEGAGKVAARARREHRVAALLQLGEVEPALRVALFERRQDVRTLSVARQLRRLRQP